MKQGYSSSQVCLFFKQKADILTLYWPVASAVAQRKFRLGGEEEITLLCSYAAQAAYVREEAVKEFGMHYPLVETVDNYQGEENDIIILSLVRSHPSDAIGFLAVRPFFQLLLHSSRPMSQKIREKPAKKLPQRKKRNKRKGCLALKSRYTVDLLPG
ncbi:unnamed protein product [Gongylonema pulchrum]|uniref:AAA_12 domain-containing protein n=1 Tax=Gongylonema pulchrum TaxID=637853 RepID=A0A183DGU4_9BILA|nr:unnamed protein product [Gongylonema pulchrum]